MAGDYFRSNLDKIVVKVGALGPSGPFGLYGPVEGGPAERVGIATAAEEVEGYGSAGGGPPAGVAAGTPRIRVAQLGGSCCALLPVTQTHNIGKAHNTSPQIPVLNIHFSFPWHLSTISLS